MKERYERIFDLDIEMQLSYGAEKKQFKLLMEAEEAKMDNYTYSIDQLDSLSEIHNQDLTFVNNALMTHTIDERIAYYHVSALVNNEIKYLAISPVTSQFWEPLGAFDMPVLTH